MSKILVTGAGGFIGQALCSAMQERNIDFVPVLRTPQPSLPQARIVADINPDTDWRASLDGVSVVIHLAARVHKFDGGAVDHLREYRLMNVEATLNLARQCVQAGVRRLVFLSSIKVNGESTTSRPFFSGDAPAPLDSYGISKCEAEQRLRQLALETGLEVVVIRPPLVYGPGVKANFLALMRWVQRGIPLPLASVHNRRSMIFVGNLVDLILHSVRCDAAAGAILLASDGQDVSSAELIRAVALAMGKRPRLFAVPPGILRIGAALIGKGTSADRLLGSLQVDIGQTQSLLDWTPPFSFETGIALTVRDFLQAR